MSVSDLNGTFNVLVFNKRLFEFRNIIKENNIVLIEGKVNIDDRGDRANIYPDKIYLASTYIEMVKEKEMPAKVILNICFKDFE